MYSQLQFDGEESIYYGTSANSIEEVDAAWDVINATNMTLELNCRRYALQEVPGTVSNFCWGLLCIAWGTGHYNASNPDDAVIMAPNEVNHTFKAKYRHQGQAGEAIYRYCIYEKNGLVENVCQTVQYCVDANCVVSTEDLSPLSGSIEVSPNPIERIGNITYRFKNAPTSGKLCVYNLVGTKVKEVPLSNREGVVFVAADDFESGLYLCNIEDNGHVFQTVRMVIQ